MLHAVNVIDRRFMKGEEWRDGTYHAWHRNGDGHGVL